VAFRISTFEVFTGNDSLVAFEFICSRCQTNTPLPLPRFEEVPARSFVILVHEINSILIQTMLVGYGRTLKEISGI
jgi:hypothetical protein